ncbi:MAG: sulfur carrier protein ThiS adenylyltransferase ThiF [Coriobacteriia bacterium]|nr:sulfur carrier protein ThiS adenylyltransferase ThiF [Coriobacteriia bacterium]
MNSETPRECPPPLEPEDDPALRARLAASHVAIIGCGGLGSNAAAMLVRSGVATLTLIDYDTVEEDNLNRQLFFRDQLGMHKTDAITETLRRIKPDVHLTLVRECMDPDNLLSSVGDADVVIEAVDRAETKAMIVNVLSNTAPHLPLVSASGLAGFDSANEVVTERIGENFYLVGDCRSDVRAGLPLLASRVMVAAAHQSHAAIRVLLGYPEP